mmetsp:Transcript_41271/g.78882  ORF Transcript_41271/g.78882 Transcript_41271/m.78882 type:complete len:127 (+) Transcript_41271:242-622(+)|eukprot:CAMPEP_0114237938 /NCGR_PEP_ID=MMETSP0058-20121206/7660_1 /TAXON_ID=36894 /ORGANISM="Pyramimonas parkeae, CCMP726" /LENGTH=126 /DNA_ID=CAMNT_0001350019 /DNA_START=165 /DNA_END=545 /DNA_ORIENTATION=-
MALRRLTANIIHRQARVGYMEGGYFSRSWYSNENRSSSDTMQAEAKNGLLEVFDTESSKGGIDQEELAERRAAAVNAMMVEQLGEERGELARILGKHRIMCRGGREEAEALMDALVSWKHRGNLPN